MSALRVGLGLFVLALAYRTVHCFFGHQNHEPMHINEHSYYPVHMYNKVKIPVPYKVPVIIKPIIKTIRVPVKVPVKVPYPVKVKQPYPVKVPYPVKIPYPFPVKIPVYHKERVPVPVPVPYKVPVVVKEPYPVKHIVPIRIKEPYVIRVKDYSHYDYEKKPAYETVSYKEPEYHNTYESAPNYGAASSYGPAQTYNAPATYGEAQTHSAPADAQSTYAQDVNNIQYKEEKTPQAPVYASENNQQFYQENGYTPVQSAQPNYEQQQSDEYEISGQVYGAASTVEQEEQKPAVEQTYTYPRSYVTETDYRTGQVYAKPANYVQEGVQVQSTSNNYEDKEYKSKK